MAQSANRYTRLIENIFLKRYRKGTTEIMFERIDIADAAEDLGIMLPKNLGDVLYSFRYRIPLPMSITQKAPGGYAWIIRPAGRARYKFMLTQQTRIMPSANLVETKIPDATPGVISKYAMSDEQALLAKIRYNRLIDIFTGLTCYSLQNHFRTTVGELGQVETDELYIGIDKRGAHYVLTVQAKGKNEKLGIVQIEQDFAVCAGKFAGLIARPIAAQFLADNRIVLFEFEQSKEDIRVSAEKHYRLVPPEELSEEELRNYRKRPL
jgi:hypothetical protein